ncbi:GrpB family protein [Psychrobacillus sp. FJAT-51614]|uniref:GrpB family protein n=1 Tax=Psychrobacillus mangrovi TaxID=3117745 RepID=A0ABU8F2U7_9BACI
MLKRRYGNRSDWKRILEREYTQKSLEKKEFTGLVTLLNLVRVAEPLWVDYGDKRICIVDDGYSWMQHFPVGKNYTLTTMFNAKDEIVQWYIDICNEIGMENNLPWWDDLFLDIIVLPGGEIIQQDENELEEALSKGDIDQKMFSLAWDEANSITSLLKEGKFELLHYSTIHKKQLEKHFYDEESKMRKVEVLPYSVQWKEQFEEEARMLNEIFGSHIIDIHHIGSTSIIGLKAKPIIDIMPVVRDISTIDTYNTTMIDLGYLPKGENGLPGRRYFQKGGDNRTHHVHIYELGNPEIERHLAFRDYLRVNPQSAQEYGELKEMLSKKFPYNIDAYINGKEELASEIERKAIQWKMHHHLN